MATKIIKRGRPIKYNYKIDEKFLRKHIDHKRLNLPLYDYLVKRGYVTMSEWAEGHFKGAEKTQRAKNKRAYHLMAKGGLTWCETVNPATKKVCRMIKKDDE